MYGGMSVPQAIESAFQMTPAEMDADLRRYLQEKRVQVRRLPLPAGMEAVTYVLRKLKDYEAEALIADLQLHTDDRWEPALKTFQTLAQQYPYFAPAHRGAGYAYFRKGDMQQAEKAFRRAAELDSPDPHVYYFIAYSIYRRMGDKIDPEDLVEMNELLDNAIKLEPAFPDAYNLKAFALSNASNVPAAIKQMKIAISLEPRNEQFQLNLANQYMLVHRWDEANALLDRLKISSDPAIAKSAAENAAKMKEWKEDPLSQLAGTADTYTAPQWRRKSGTDPEMEKLEAAQTGVEQEPAKGPVKFARGVLVSAECAENGSATVQLMVGAKRLKLRAADAKKILVIGADGFHCGWKNKPVAINYRERTPAEGDLMSVEVTTP
jgi:tetratricopeptide (TPR) repeat protein